MSKQRHDQRGLTPEEHRMRHVKLHDALDELVADYLMYHSTALPSKTTVLALMGWSAETKTDANHYKQEE